MIENNFENHTCFIKQSGCLLNSLDNSKLFFTNNTIYNMTNQNGFSAFSFESSFMFVRYNDMNLISSYNLIETCIFASSTQILIQNSSFLNYQINAVYFIDCFVILSNLIFTETQVFITDKKLISPIYAENCIYFFMNFTNISLNTHSQIGGACSVQSDSTKNIIILKNNVFFKNIASDQGGALNIVTANLTLLDSIFIENFALSSGGALLYDSLEPNNTFVYERNQFISNKAIEEGGAIKWGGVIPNSSENIFINNTAIYGGDIAAYPMKIGLEINITSEDGYCDVSSFDENSLFYSNLACVSSGNVGNFVLTIKILDIYSNIVNDLNGK